MHRLILRALGLGGALAVAVALLMLVGSSFGSGTHTASANLPTPTPLPGATPTPKPIGAGGTLTGVSDIIVDGSDPTTSGHATPVPAGDAFHCISYTQDRGDTTVKTAAQCFSNTALLANTNAEPLVDAKGEGVSDGGVCTPVSCAAGPPAPLPLCPTKNCVGPPPPPPYTPGGPAKGAGTLIGDNLDVLTCFPELGPPSGPNIIARLRVTGAVAQLTAFGYQHALVDVYENQTDAACDAARNSGTVPVVAPTLGGLGTTIYPSTNHAPCPGGTCVQSPMRPSPLAGATTTDYDGDGCTDQQELDKLDAAKCGDDPWNPNDTSLGSTDVAGDYSLLATVIDSDCNPALTGVATVCELPGDNVPGFYYGCEASLEQSDAAGTVVKAWALCYVDTPAFVINPEMASPALAGGCPGNAIPAYCGDGFPGSPPPGITVTGGTVRNFFDMDSKNTTLTGAVDTTKNVLSLHGCFEDLDGHFQLGNVYVKTQTDLHTGHGFVEIYPLQTSANCLANTPLDSPSPHGDAQLDLVRQTKGATMRDADGDGCPDRKELGDPGNTTLPNTGAGAGALRDPSNHYDYMNPTHDGQNRVDDILKVVGQYFKDDGDATPGYPPFTALYNQDTDRTALLGGNAWNLGPPDGLERVDDILAQVKQYFHDCS